MGRLDPKGYYAQLGVGMDASHSEIKAAYRRRAMRLHPDRNPDSHATGAFQRLTEAYRILSGPQQRARYDALCIELPQHPLHAQFCQGRPIPCAACGQVPLQPRYVILHEVNSFLFLSVRKPIRGIFCRDCADRKAARANVMTSLLGWWALPMGPIYSIQAIFRNILGGEQPRETNAQLLWYQAWALALDEKTQLACSTAKNALRLTRQKNLAANIEHFLGTFGADGPSPVLGNAWAIQSHKCLRRAGLALGVVAVELMLLLGGGHLLDKRAEPQVHLPLNFSTQNPFAAQQIPLPASGLLRVREQAAMPLQLAPVRIENACESRHVLVKFVEPATGRSILSAFVRAGESAYFKVPLGTYELRYAAGDQWSGEQTLFGADTIYRKLGGHYSFAREGQKILGYTFRLDMTPGGSSPLEPLARAQFQLGH